MNTEDPAAPSETPPAPWRRRAARAAVAIGAALALYLAFEIGRAVAGYSIIAAVRERVRLDDRIAHLKRDNRALQAHLVELQTLDAGHAHEDQVVTRTLAHLQAEIARQSEKLAFYKGVVAQGTPPIGLRVGAVLLSGGKRPLHYQVDLSLLRADRPDGFVSGTVSFSVDGVGPGKATLDERALTGHAALAYRFRYYQQLKQDLVLPPGFKPEHLTVTVRSRRSTIAPLIQTYPWSTISVP